MAEEIPDGGLVDVSDQGLTRLELPAGEDPVTVIGDRNSIARIENLEHCQNLRQLSLASNRLVHMSGVAKLHHLTVLNLPQNSIVSMEGVRELTSLQWLNLSGNSIKTMDNLSNSPNLRHLDLSDNSISQLGDIHMLTQLKTILLHGNMVTTLKTAPHFLAASIMIFSLAENEIVDINEVSFLSCLSALEQLSIMNNPCVLMTASVPGFDYRPFVINWCPNLKVLDGYMVSERESLKAEWLYSQGRGHHFKLGQHVEAIQYLASVCPLTASVQLESAEDAKLSQILTKQRYHQQQLHDQKPPPAGQQWNIPPHTAPPDKQSPGGDSPNISRSESVPGHSSRPDSQAHHHSNVSGHARQPVKAWAGDTSVSSAYSTLHDRSVRELNDLSVQDFVSDDYDKKSTSSLLDSESTYLPVDASNIKTPVTPAPNRPMTAPTVSAPVTMNIVDTLNRGDHRPATAIGDNKYDAYDKRPIKPLNQEVYKGLFKPDFNISQPQLCGNEPVVGAKKRAPLTAQAIDCDTSQEASQIDQVINHPKEKENVENIPTQDLTSIKDAAAKRVKKMAPKPKTDERKGAKAVEKKRDRTTESVRAHSGNKTSIPVSKAAVSRTQSEYVPGKYSAARRPANTECDTRSKAKIIKTIPEKLLSSDRLHRWEGRRDHNNSLRDSGIDSRPTSDAVLAEVYNTSDAKAAVRIQAFWRGYWARENDVSVVRVRREIRARRAEDHIVVLRTELDKQRKLYEQEKQLRTLQLEAIRHLWKEVQSLQNWKNEILSSQTFPAVDTNKREDSYNSYNNSLEIQATLARAEMIHRMDDSLGSASGITQTPGDVEKQRELTRTCASLQSQVTQLQETLKSVSSIVLQNSISTPTSAPPSAPPSARSNASSSLETPSSASKEEDGIVVTADFDEVEVTSFESLAGALWGSVPHSLSPYPSEEEDAYFRQVPQPGFPTPPRGLKLEHRGNSALVLRWHQSRILDGDGREVHKPLLGYRVFVNDKPKAMIAGTKQKALIEGLDPSLTYKIYVKAVSALGESNSSDVVMAALSKGRRRSSSSDSNQSYDSDRESTESDRKAPHRKDSYRKSRKTKSSPRAGRREKPHDSSRAPKQGQNTPQERPMSKVELEAEGIMTQPKLHMHRRTRSRDSQSSTIEDNLNLRPKETPVSPVHRSPKMPAQESQGFSFDGPHPVDNGSEMEHNLSSTFTVDSQNSVLLALSNKSFALEVDSADSATMEDIKGQRRRRSRESKVDTRGDVSDSSSSVSSANIQGKNLDLSGERNLSGTDSPSVRRCRSKEFSKEDGESVNRSDSKRSGSAKVSPTAGSQGVPVIDGRKRHSSGSRPSSPAHSDVVEPRPATSATERRRMPVAELLEQRMSSRVGQSSSSTASSATLTQSQVDDSVSDLPPQIPRRDVRQSGSMENLSSRLNNEPSRSPTDKYSPVRSERHRTSSTCSESDLSVSTASRQLDLEKKNSNNNGNSGIVAKLLQKLQTFSKSQEESLRSTKYKRKPGDPAGDEERVQSGRKASGDSDTSESMPSKTAGHSDSSGAHSDDSQQVVRPSYRTHRRTNSDHRGVPVKMSDRPPSPSPSQRPPSSSPRADHSPVIMDNASSGKPSSSNNIKRHASFHGILPSKKEDLVRSGSHENLSEKNTPMVKQQNIDVTVPTTPTRRRRHRSRSKSPTASSTHVPIISAAQLQKQTKVQVT